jgi:hypothetical protein
LALEHCVPALRIGEHTIEDLGYKAAERSRPRLTVFSGVGLAKKLLWRHRDALQRAARYEMSALHRSAKSDEVAVTT